MEYKEDKIRNVETGGVRKKPVSQLVIEENTIYEIDLECQCSKGKLKKAGE